MGILLNFYGSENVFHPSFETFLHKSRRLYNLKINNLMSYNQRRIRSCCGQGVLKLYSLDCGRLSSAYELHYWNPSELPAIFYVT